MRHEQDPRNIVRHARAALDIAVDANREILVQKMSRGQEKPADRLLAWTSYYALVFAALVAFLPYEVAFAFERTADIADKVGGIVGITDGWGIHIRGTLD